MDRVVSVIRDKGLSSWLVGSVEKGEWWGFERPTPHVCELVLVPRDLVELY